MVTATTVALLVLPAGLALAEEVALGQAQTTEAQTETSATETSATETKVEASTGNAHSVEVAQSPDDAATTEPSQQDSTEPEVEIGEPHAVECRGAVTVTVVDLAGNPVPGGILMVAGQQLVDGGTVDTGCGETTASLLGIPEGHAVVGEASTAVVVRNKTATPVVFRVDPVEVLDAEVAAPATAPASAPTPSPVPEAAPAEAAPAQAAATGPELARTGIDDPEVLGLLALALLAAGITILRRTPTAPR